MDEGTRDPVGAGARLGRGLGGRLGTHHHRSRSARFGLLFERFLNPERVSMPDFDIDFCQERRDEVIAYVRERYGASRVAQIVAFGSFLARGVLRISAGSRNAARPVDQLAKLVPPNPAHPVTLQQAVADDAAAGGGEGRTEGRRMLAITERSRGLCSTPATHAAASSSAIGGDRAGPVYRDPKSAMPATQFNMKWVESAGLVKFDFLRL